MTTQKVNITLNGYKAQVDKGTMILDAAKENGIIIPTLCYHKDLCVAGNCRVCVVEIGGQKRLSVACATPCEEGMEVMTNSLKVRNSRKHIIELLLADNVFPDVDVLNIDPLRALIHEVFNRHIIHAPGMAKFGELTHWGILPTPGAVLRGAELFAEELGDCLVFDVGGATTDVHSVTEGNSEWASRMVEPEPRAKRTVEGDLGVFVNARNIVDMAGNPEWEARLAELQAMPATERERELTRALCAFAVDTGAKRHAGIVTDLFTPTGRKRIVKGKDLSAVRWVIGTGGALTRIEGGAEILRTICTGPGKYLLPLPESRLLLDRDYLFSALGTLAQAYPEDVKATFRRWVETEKPRA